MSRQAGWSTGPRIPGLNAICQWQLQRTDLGDDLSLLLVLRGCKFAEFAARVDEMAKLSTGAAPEIVSEIVPAPAFTSADRYGLSYHAVRARAEFLQLLASENGVDGDWHPRDRIVRMAVGSNLSALPLPKRERIEWEADGKTVIMAIIDEGIPLLHPRFRSGNGSCRVEYAWLQGAPARDGRQAPGREFTASELDAAVAEARRVGGDEDHAYAACGLVDHAAGLGRLARRATHGAHVASLLAGFDPSDNCTDRPIIAVELPHQVTADTSGGQLEPHVLAALDYIFARADDIAASRGADRLPLVINFSYGFLAGPHDGTQNLELAFDSRLRQRRDTGAPTELVLPSGNSHLERCHAQYAFRAHGEVWNLDWRVLPDDETDSFVEIWLPPLTAEPETRFEISLTPPGGEQSPWLGEGEAGTLEWTLGGQVLASVAADPAIYPSNRTMFLLSLKPSAHPARQTPLAPAGTWRISLRSLAHGPGDIVEAYVQRDDRPFGHERAGRQSHFVDPDYTQLDKRGALRQTDDGKGAILRGGSFNAIATGAETIVAGALTSSTGGPSPYSGCGPLPFAPTRLPGSGRDPDSYAMVDKSYVTRGRISAGTHAAARLRLSGTSIAAPQRARQIADAIARGEWRVTS